MNLKNTVVSPNSNKYRGFEVWLGFFLSHNLYFGDRFVSGLS